MDFWPELKLHVDRYSIRLMEIPKPNNENFPLDIHETHGRRSKHSHRLAVNLLDLHQWSVVISCISQKFTDQLFLLPFAFDFNSANRKFEKTKAKWCTLAHVSVSVSLPLEVYFCVCFFFLLLLVRSFLVFLMFIGHTCEFTSISR